MIDGYSFIMNTKLQKTSWISLGSRVMVSEG